MPELTHAGYRTLLEWDAETGHWFGQIDGTEVRFSAGHYPDAVALFHSTAEVLYSQDMSSPNADEGGS